MGGKRIPGPIGAASDRMCLVDPGTVNRQRSPTPGPVEIAATVGEMPLTDRFVEVLRRTTPLLPGEIQQEFALLLSPTNLLIMAGTLAVWAGSHYFGVGFVVDVLLLIVGVGFLGAMVWTAASDFVTALQLTAGARTSDDLDRAAEHLANFIAVVGVAAFMALVFKGAKTGATKVGAAAAEAAALARRYSGMTAAHFGVFQEVAQVLKRIIIVRNTNLQSTRWIERGFPPKPIEIKIKTSPKTGIVTANTPGDIATARSKGYFVVDPDGVPRNAAGHELKLPARPEWPVEPGQVVHPQQHKPLVGDYDLLGVVNPEAPGRNIVLAASEGQILDDWSNPEIRRVADLLNARMDQPRVMHGAHEGRFDLPDKGGSTVFFPDGSTRALLTPDDVTAFYEHLGRQTITGRY